MKTYAYCAVVSQPFALRAKIGMLKTLEGPQFSPNCQKLKTKYLFYVICYIVNTGNILSKQTKWIFVEKVINK